MTAIGAAIYVGLAIWVNADELAAALATTDVGLVAVAFVAALAAYALRTWRWHYLLRRLRLDLPLGVSALVFVSSFALTITPGKMGELVKLYQVQRRAGKGYAK